MDVTRLPTLYLPGQSPAPREQRAGGREQANSVEEPKRQESPFKENLPAEPVLQGEVVNDENGAALTADDSAERLRFRFGAGTPGNDTARPMDHKSRTAIDSYRQTEAGPKHESEAAAAGRRLDEFI